MDKNAPGTFSCSEALVVTTKKLVCRSWVCCRLLSLLRLSTSRDPLKK